MVWAVVWWRECGATGSVVEGVWCGRYCGVVEGVWAVVRWRECSVGGGVVVRAVLWCGRWCGGVVGVVVWAVVW